jgi:hypothetical protein
LESKSDAKGHSQRRPSNRDEFDGPHQFIPRPPPEYIAQQEKDLPHLPTNLVVREQDSILTRVNDRLSQCAFDFVAKYQFPIPLANGEMRPVERPQDWEWTEWVYLLKRLATKRRIPARVLYNGQIKQFITILENSLEMGHAAKHQSRPLKDDRNILQLISAGIQVAKLLRDANAMTYMDQLYIATENTIRERSSSSRPSRSLGHPWVIEASECYRTMDFRGYRSESLGKQSHGFDPRYQGIHKTYRGQRKNLQMNSILL